MSVRRGRRQSSTGVDELDAGIDELLDEASPPNDRELLRDILVSGVRFATEDVDRLDLKIVSAALREMRAAFDAFAPYHDRPKVTVFGSARTRPDDPLYGLARDLAHDMAAEGWMIVTGAGPGIMQAAMEGAGVENSFGVLIRLPFEGGANPVIAGDSKLVSMKYFFTRKLMLMKESSAYVSLPGGFGTLDEMFELLTLQQTGKAIPAPLVLLDIAGGTYWAGWRRFVAEQVETLGLISPGDIDLATITDSIDVTRRVIRDFRHNYLSIRWVGTMLVIRLRRSPTETQLAELNGRFGSLSRDGSGIVMTAALPAEVADDDEVDLPRIKVALDQHKVGRLHELIGALNTF